MRGFIHAWHLAAFIILLPIQGAGSDNAAIRPPELKWREGYPFEAGSERGTAILSVADSTVSAGEILDLQVAVRCDAGALKLFNPFFDSKLPSPARLVVFDDQKRYYGDLITVGEQETATRESTSRDWVLVCGLCSAGARFRFRLDHCLRLTDDFRGTPLAMRPGKYFVQAIYSHRAVEAAPAGLGGQRTERQTKRWNDRRIDSERFRSNTVEIRIASESEPRSPAPPAAPIDASSQSAEKLSVQSDLRCGFRRGRATISMTSLKLAIGASAGLAVRFENTSSNTYQVFNPFFNRLIHEPAALAIYDSKKRYLGDLLCFELGSMALAEPTHWIVLPEGAVTEAILPIFGGRVPCTRFGSKERRLPPGKYYLQILFRPCFATSAPRAPVVSPCSPFKRKADDGKDDCCGGIAQDSNVFFRSNILEIELLDASLPRAPGTSAE